MLKDKKLNTESDFFFFLMKQRQCDVKGFISSTQPVLTQTSTRWLEYHVLGFCSTSRCLFLTVSIVRVHVCRKEYEVTFKRLAQLLRGAKHNNNAILKSCFLSYMFFFLCINSNSGKFDSWFNFILFHFVMLCSSGPV